VSLVAGAHADEPVGPALLSRLVTWLAGSDDSEAHALLEAATFAVCPHVNPDGAARNAAWASVEPYELRRYLEHVVRERPGDDVEFGYPRDEDDWSESGARPENRAVAAFLRDHGPFDFHASLHGMMIAEGAWCLIDRDHIDATSELRSAIASEATRLGFSLHDWDRGGEKGFHRIEPGFCTTPTSVAMREHFESLDDPDEAAKFRLSSMEFVATLGGDPLRLVSEIPLFDVTASPPEAPRLGDHFLTVKDALGAAALESANGDDSALASLEKRFGLVPVENERAMRLQLAMVLLGAGLVIA